MEPDYRSRTSVRSKIPKDGPGPRGAPEIYYTSRVLNSTAWYEQYLKKLRQSEKEFRRIKEETLKEAEEKYKLSFFTRCRRRSLLNKVEDRFNACMQAYEDDLNIRKEKLINLYDIEEKKNMSKLVQQVYDGRKAAWQDTEDRLAYLLDKRMKEREAKYASKEIYLSKCIHALPLIKEKQTRETAKDWEYQVQEKLARKMADKEDENMWHDVLMKETEALNARMEVEAIDRYRRDLKAKEDTDRHLEIRRAERAKQQEMLKRETLQMIAKIEQNRILEEEEQRQHQKIQRERVKEINDGIKERKEAIIRQQNKAKAVSDTWASLTNQGLGDEYNQRQLKKKQERDIAECNLKLAEQNQRFAKQKYDNEPLILEEQNRLEQADYTKRNELSQLSRRLELESRAAIVQQMKEKEQSRLKEHDKTLEYRHQVSEQLEKLIKHKEITDEQAKKFFYEDLLEQVKFTKVLKERTRQEAEEQNRKYQIATREYQEQILLHRPKYGNDHPFMKQIKTSSSYKDSALKTKPASLTGPSRLWPN